MDEKIRILLSADPYFSPLTRPTTLQATQSTHNTSNQIANTLYPNINDPLRPPRDLHKSLSANLTTQDKTIFPRLPTPSFSKISAGLPLAQMIPQTKIQSHQPQISTFETPIPPKMTTVNKPSTVNIHLPPISVMIVRPKPSIPSFSPTANFTEASHSNSSHPYTNPQPKIMFTSPYQWTIPSNDTPPTSMATQHPFSTTPNLPVQTHIPVPSFQPYTLNVLHFLARSKFLTAPTINTDQNNFLKI